MCDEEDFPHTPTGYERIVDNAVAYVEGKQSTFGMTRYVIMSNDPIPADIGTLISFVMLTIPCVLSTRITMQLMRP